MVSEFGAAPTHFASAGKMGLGVPILPSPHAAGRAGYPKIRTRLRFSSYRKGGPEFYPRTARSPAAGYSQGVSVSFQFPLSASQSAFSCSRLRPRP